MVLRGHKIHEKCWSLKRGKIVCLSHRCDLYAQGYDRKINGYFIHVPVGCFEAFFLQKYCHGQLAERVGD